MTETAAFRDGECAPPRNCGCPCHQPGGMSVKHFAPCCDQPPVQPALQVCPECNNTDPDACVRCITEAQAEPFTRPTKDATDA